MANNLNDILITQFKKAFVLTDLETGLVQSAFYLGYFVLALPAGLVMRAYGYKAAVIFGLVLYGAGALLFYPAAQAAEYGYFLAALFVIAAGLAFLETAANPLITVLGPPETAARRLNLAQAFNPVGSITGLLIGKYAILSGIEHSSAALDAMPEAQRQAFLLAETRAVQGPYLAIGVFVLAWAALVAVTRFPAAASRPVENDGETVNWRQSISGLFRRPQFLFGVVAQFFYIGAQVGVWSFTIRYAQAVTNMGERSAANWIIAATALFLVGRFVGVALMRRIAPVRLMAVYAAVSVVLALGAVTLPGMAGLVSLTAISFFMSVMFPTIFALSVEGLGPYAYTGSSLVVMAIVGGAVLTPAMGAVSTVAGIRAAMLVPAFCFTVVGAFALINLRAARPA